MIQGCVDEYGTPEVELTVRGMRGAITTPATVDTGFDGEVSLPIELAVALGLELVGFAFIELGDGTVNRELVFLGTASIGGVQKEIEIFLTDSEEALLGRGWFAEGSLYINFQTGELIIGEVIEQ